VIDKDFSMPSQDALAAVRVENRNVGFTIGNNIAAESRSHTNKDWQEIFLWKMMRIH
jgi:hypothetical protein